MDKITPDWTSLPQDLLTSIAKRLGTRVDILRLRAVCRSFRRTIPRPSKHFFPHSVLTTTDFLRSPNPSDDDEHGLFFLIESTVYAIEPINETFESQTWMIQIEESEPGRVQLKDPLSGYRFSYKSFYKKLPNSINLLDYRVKEISKSYGLELSADRKGKRQKKLLVPVKVIVSSSLDESDDGFAVMAQYNREDQGRQLFMWRNVDKKWSEIDKDLSVKDIIYHNHKFYALLTDGVTVTVDSKSLIVTQVAGALQEVGFSFSLVYLVESFKDLFLISQCIMGDEYFLMVFKLNEEKRKWFRVVNGSEFKDRVLFNSQGGSFSISAQEFPACKGNCVYFSGDEFDSGTRRYPGQNAWMFHFNHATAWKLSNYPPYSNLFWPPPIWLWY